MGATTQPQIWSQIVSTKNTFSPLKEVLRVKGVLGAPRARGPHSPWGPLSREILLKPRRNLIVCPSLIVHVLFVQISQFPHELKYRFDVILKLFEATLRSPSLCLTGTRALEIQQLAQPPSNLNGTGIVFCFLLLNWSQLQRRWLGNPWIQGFIIR